MRVKIGPYVNWTGPYQIADKIFFWCERNPSDEQAERWDYKAQDWLGNFLAHGFYKKDPNDYSLFNEDEPVTWFYKLLSWIHSKQKRTVDIKLDRWDTWNMDSTLALIILPMLKQLKATKHGSPNVDLEDVPEHLRFTETEEYDSQQCFDFYNEDDQKIVCDVHTRWNWVLDEMIWTFEQFQPDCDWENQYTIGEVDLMSVPCEFDENGKPKLFSLEHGPKHTAKTDWDAVNRHQARIDNGLVLFGKYYRGLWD